MIEWKALIAEAAWCVEELLNKEECKANAICKDGIICDT
jgi:hypothetical protein